MESFHITVLTIATIIFIIALTTIGVMMQKGSRAGTFPPTASNCPDGWTETSTVNATTNVATYRCSAPVDFTAVLIPSADFSVIQTPKSFSYNDGSTSICDKKKWGDANNITWDGVSNYNSC